MPKPSNDGVSSSPAPTVSGGENAPASTESAGRSARGAPAPTGGEPRAAADTTDPGQRPADGRGRTVSPRKKQYVIAPRQLDGLHAMNFMPLQFSDLERTLRSNDDIDVIHTVVPKATLAPSASLFMLADDMGVGRAPVAVVARMTEQKAALLHQQGGGQLLIEHDQHLTLMDPALRQPAMVTGVLPANGGPVLNAAIGVAGKDGAPLAEAEVSLIGCISSASGVTDANGQVTLSLHGETPESVRGLYVKPKSDYWSFYQRDPDISTDEANVVVLRALSDWPSLAGFPRQRAYGWGQKAMRLDQLPGNYRGQGIKIAIIDSGAATTHDNLQGIKFGLDVLNRTSNPDGWKLDSLGHGSHCAGVISAADITSGIHGFAPDAEVHACKLFPGGQIGQLIAALEYCIDKQVDVVNLSLGGAEVSGALEQQILRAKRAGIACIVAAGNSGGAVQYPASSPNVLAVAAVGKLDEFPADSYHAQTLDQNVDAYGYFTAKFSCFGPQVAVCAPGVAITSCVPPNNFAAWDGTSMATPHVTGLAALTLAHHPDFQTPQYKARGAERVERLFQIIRASARRVSLADQSRIGFGMPDVLVAVGLQNAVMQQPAPAVAPQPTSVMAPMMAPPQLGANMGNAVGGLMGGGAVYDPLGLDMARAAQMAAYGTQWPQLHVGRFPLPQPYNPIMW